MGSKSNYLETAILNHVLGTPALTKPAAVYLGLFVTTPDESASPTGTEVSTTSTGYQRQAITFSAASNGSITGPSTAITFPTATGSWGSVTGWGVFDAQTSGNLLYYGSLSATKTITTGDTASVAAGQVVITED